MSHLRFERQPFDPAADRHGRRWVNQPGEPLWTEQRREEVALPGVGSLDESPAGHRRHRRPNLAQPD